MREVVPFESEHVVPAAELVAHRVRAAVAIEPLLPPGLEDWARVQGLLGGLVRHRLGVAAVEDGRLLGFLGAVGLELWGGHGAYVPEWGHSARDAEMVSALHEAASRRWMAEDRAVQAVTLWADDAEGEAAWHHLGFGRVLVDTLRDLTPPRGIDAVEVRRATRADAPVAANLERRLWEHLAAPPTCRVYPPPRGELAMAERLEDGRRPVWLAFEGTVASGYVSLEPHDEVPASLAAPDVVRCDGAFVVPEARRCGIGRTVLATALGWAAGAGFSRCAIDYESANREASRFWPSMGCRPVMHSVARRLATGT